MNTEEFLKGYEEGLRDAWKIVMRMIVKGHTPKEIALAIKAKLSTIDALVEEKKRKILIGEERFELAPKDFKSTQRVDYSSHRPGIYLIVDDHENKIKEILISIANRRTPLLVISRETRDGFIEKYGVGGKFEHIWVTKTSDRALTPSALVVEYGREEQKTVSPTNLSSLSSHVSSFVKKWDSSAIVLDSLTYIVTQNGFGPVLKFIQYIGDLTRKHNARVYMPIISSSFQEREFSLLRSEATSMI